MALMALGMVETRGLVAGKSDYLAVDALYNLLKDLYVVPLGIVGNFKKAMIFGFMLIDGMPLDKCREAMADFDLKGLEKYLTGLFPNDLDAQDYWYKWAGGLDVEDPDEYPK